MCVPGTAGFLTVGAWRRRSATPIRPIPGPSNTEDGSGTSSGSVLFSGVVMSSRYNPTAAK